METQTKNLLFSYQMIYPNIRPNRFFFSFFESLNYTIVNVELREGKAGDKMSITKPRNQPNLNFVVNMHVTPFCKIRFGKVFHVRRDGINENLPIVK